MTFTLLFVYSCKKEKDDDSNDDTTTTVTDEKTVYYVKYDMADTTYNFSTTSPESFLGEDVVICRIGYPDDFYSGIDIELETPNEDVLTAADVKALEGKFVPIYSDDNSEYNSIYVKISTLTPDTYYSYFVDSVDQKGSFFIKRVTQLPSSRFSPQSKILEVEGSFSSNLSGDMEISNGKFLLKFSFWPEY
jgi:hypothetical protein